VHRSPAWPVGPVGNRDVIHKSTGTYALTGSQPPTNCPEEPNEIVRWIEIILAFVIKHSNVI
ncbi:MAG: hypothetical protein LC647_00920, partial [Beggiatoa sp.]|nr:hypothetical protein [Beggiatoa sp.]